MPPGGHFIKIDRHTGLRLPDYAEGANVQAEYIRDGQELMVGGYGKTVDGGWKMGADVPLFDNVRNSPAIERVTVRGQTGAAVEPVARLDVERRALLSPPAAPPASGAPSSSSSACSSSGSDSSAWRSRCCRRPRS